MRSASSAFDAASRQDDLERATGADEAWEPLGAAVAGDDAEAHLGQAEHRVLGGEPHVTRQRQLAPASEGVAVDCRDDGLVRALRARRRRAARSAKCPRPRARSSTASSLMSAPEMKLFSPAPVTIECALYGIGDERPRGRLDLGERLAVQRVQDVGAIHEQDRDGPARFDLKISIGGHGGRGRHEA